MNDKPQRYRAPALDKGLDILELLASKPRPLSVNEISEGIGRSRSEIFRMLQVLEERKYLVKNPGDTGYALTNRLFMLGMQQPRIRNITEIALPAMRRLAEETLQPCHLVVSSDEQIVVIAQVDAPSDLGLVVRVGHRRPLTHSASGLVWFAFQDPQVQKQCLERLDADSVTYQRRRFLKDAELVRKQGYAKQPSEAVVGVVDLSAPIRQYNHVAYVLTVPIIERKPMPIGIDSVVKLLCASADGISHALTYGASPEP